jgi:hypothetical protein
VETSIVAADEKARAAAYREQLRRVDAALIYYHSANVEWLRRRTMNS